MYSVYILTNKNKTVLYIGVTGHLAERIQQHRAGEVEGFTKRYNVHHLMYYETYQTMDDAKKRERAMKKWNRSWKEKLITQSNPNWDEIVL